MIIPRQTRFLLSRRSQLGQARSLSSVAAAAIEDETTSNYDHLFQPLDLGPHIGILPNRVLMGSMHSGLEGHSLPRWMLPVANFAFKSNYKEHDMSQMAEYFATRARGGVGLMVTGGIAPNREGWTGPFSSQLTNEYEMEHHKVVTEAVHSIQVPIIGGDSVRSRIVMQILHTGRYAYHPWAVSASNTKSPISPFPAKALDKTGIQRTIRDYVNTAVLAKRAGYDGVEIMGSEGYLLSQFLAPRTNKRTDEYGGSLENRARMPLEIIRQTRKAVGEDFIIIFRLSLLDLVDQGLSFEESVELAQRVQDAGCTIINTGIGWHEARVPTIATSVPRGAFAFPTKRLKEAGVVDIPLVSTNRINDPRTANDLLEQGASDMISMARPFLADPELLLKAREGRAVEINTCIGCNQACLDHVFVGKIASCLVNPVACHEEEFDFSVLPEAERLNISVVGAGPAGCAFAISAARKGHNVTLFDRDDKIGGQFNMAKRIPGKEEFYETLRYFDAMLKKYNVNVKLGTEISSEDMESDSLTNKWIISTGVDPRDPKIPGQDHPNVLSYIDVLKRQKPVGEKVAVIGAGGIGFDISEYLLHYERDKRASDVSHPDFWKEWGIDYSLTERGGLTQPRHFASKRKITLLQRKKGKLGAGLGKTTGWIHRATLNQSGAVHMVNGVSYEKIDENGHLHVKNSKGEIDVLDVDTIVICAGQVEKRDLVSEKLSDKLFLIGGAYAAGELDAKRAIDMGTRLAVKIHEAGVVPGKHVFSAPVGIEEKMYGLLRKIS
jgi:2,4-dienoyl-CoA reductase (NADPH2)